MAGKTLLITADDYGMSALFNRGIVEMARIGLVKNVSVMVNERFLDAAELTKLPVALGVHLDLPDNASQAQVEEQVQKFSALVGRPPDYLDGHGHCHISENNINDVAAVASKYGLPVRSRKDEDRETLRRLGLNTPDSFLSWHPTRTEKLVKKLQENTCSVTELVTHPGYQDPECEYPYNGRREDELNYLKSDAFRLAIAGYTIDSFKALQAA